MNDNMPAKANIHSKIENHHHLPKFSQQNGQGNFKSSKAA
jgi:hypothetical protein